MTGLKVASMAVSAVVAGGLSLTQLIVATMPHVRVPLAEASTVTAVSESTPVAAGLVIGGIGAAVWFAWKISRAWYQMEAKVTALQDDLDDLDPNRNQRRRSGNRRHRHVGSEPDIFQE